MTANSTIVGNLTQDPELRFTSGGAAVANVTIASTPRRFNKDTNQWEDGETLFIRGSLWRAYAENVAESLTKGMQVIATGELKQRNWTTDEGEKRSVVELDIAHIGPALQFATAAVTRNAKAGGSAPQAASQSAPPKSAPASAPADDDDF